MIARNSSFQYKGKNVDIRTVADALGATYVLEGSVRRSENEIRVTAQLLDPSDGTHLWAETWDRSLAVGNIFAIQDEITSAVAGVIAGAHGVIARVEVEDILRGDVGSLEAYECVLLTQAYERSANQDSWNRAYGCLANVLDNEPDQAEALAAFAFLSSDSYAGFFGDETQRDKHGRDSDRAIKEALKLAPGNPKIQWMAMYVKFVLGDIEGFRMHADRARALNPNDPDIKGYAGALLALSGSYDQGLAYLDEAMGLNPDYPEWWLNGTAIARWMTGDREGALAALERVRHRQNQKGDSQGSQKVIQAMSWVKGGQPWMTRPYSEDLRERVVRVVESGTSRNAAAKQFDVSISFVVKLMQRWKQRGTIKADKYGGWKKSKLAPHGDRIRALVMENCDITIDELCVLLAAEGIEAKRSTLGDFLLAQGLSRKKRQPTPPSRSALTSRRREPLGATSNLG